MPDLVKSLRPATAKPMANSSISTANLIDEFIKYVQDYLSWDFVKQLNAAMPKASNPLSAKIAQDFAGAEENQNKARSDLARTGRELATAFKALGKDSSSLLMVLNCADGGVGPAKVRPLWPQLKIGLQRTAIQLRNTARPAPLMAAGGSKTDGHDPDSSVAEFITERDELRASWIEFFRSKGWHLLDSIPHEVGEACQAARSEYERMLGRLHQRHGIADDDPRVFTIARYLAESKAIDDEWKAICRQRGWSPPPKQVHPDHKVWWEACREYEARKAQIRANHFDDRLNTLPKIWNSVQSKLIILRRLEGIQNSADPRKLAEDVHRPFDLMFWNDISDRPPRPPGPFTIDTAIHELEKLSSWIEQRDAMRCLEYTTKKTGTSRIAEVVVLIHGIRTFANWQPMVKRVLEEIPNTRVIPIKYGFLNAFCFWCPLFTRKAPIEDLRREIQNASAQNPSAQLSVIAHSFGTYAISQILLEHPNIKLHRVILSGAIVPRSFRWDYVRSRLSTDVLNDYGTRDIWPVLARCLSWGYGDTGRHGFGRGATVIDRGHNYAHSDFFNEEFVRNYWKPWFEDGRIVPSPWEEQAPPPSWFLSVLSFLPLQWIFCLLMVALSAWFGNKVVKSALVKWGTPSASTQAKWDQIWAEFTTFQQRYQDRDSVKSSDLAKLLKSLDVQDDDVRQVRKALELVLNSGGISSIETRLTADTRGLLADLERILRHKAAAYDPVSSIPTSSKTYASNWTEPTQLEGHEDGGKKTFKLRSSSVKFADCSISEVAFLLRPNGDYILSLRARNEYTSPRYKKDGSEAHRISIIVRFYSSDKEPLYTAGGVMLDQMTFLPFQLVVGKELPVNAQGGRMRLSELYQEITQVEFQIDIAGPVEIDRVPPSWWSPEQ